MIPVVGAKECCNMIQIDGFYLYSSGYSIHPLSEMKADDPFDRWLFPLYVAQNAIDVLLKRSVFQIRSSRAAGDKLLSAVTNLLAEPTRATPVTAYEAYLITTALSEFEHVLAAELGMMNLWLVLKKRGYDTSDLIQQGWVLFPDDLIRKVPEALIDAVSATQCIAF